jgi:hypothetical protein
VSHNGGLERLGNERRAFRKLSGFWQPETHKPLERSPKERQVVSALSGLPRERVDGRGELFLAEAVSIGAT